MKILFLTPWYPSKNAPFFGTFAREHAHAIRLVGHDVYVFAILIQKGKGILHCEVNEYTDQKGVHTVTIELSSFFKNILYYMLPIQYYFLTRQVRKIIESKKMKFDLIHTNVVYPTGIFGNYLAKKLRLPYVLTEHWTKVYRIMQIPFYANLSKRAYRQADRILPVSRYLQENIQEQVSSLRKHKFRVIGNIIDVNLFQPLLAKRDKQSKPIVFTAIAHWNKTNPQHKLPELFIDALAKINLKSSLDIHLIMIGGGNQLEELKNRCLQKNLSANFTDYLTKDKIAAILQESDFFVHASSTETFCVVAAEALSCGIPVICSNVGALPELVNASNGVLCDNTVEDWVQGIEKVMITKYDSLKISKALRNKFSYESIGEQINQVYLETITNNQNV